MQINLNKYIYIASAVLFALPLFAFAQVSFPAGVNSCGSGGGALSGGIGSSRPIGGPFVPVADYAVELNTATLVYKECIVKVTVNEQKKRAVALITRDTVNKFMTQRNGGPMFPVILARDQGQRTDTEMIRRLQDGTLDTINPAFRSLVRGAVALSYRVDTRLRNNTIACPEPNIRTATQAQDFSFGLLWREADPRCQALYSYYASKELVRQDMAYDQYEMMYRLNTSDGVYGNEVVDAEGNRLTVTPGILVQGTVEQALQSGMEILIHADDINEITDALFASMANQSMTGTGGSSTNQGLASLTGGLPGQGGSLSGNSTYLDQVLRNQFGSGGGGGSGTTTPGSLLQTLQALLQSEIQYLDAVTRQGQLFTRIDLSLASSSELCWGTATQGREVFNSYGPRVVATATNINESTATVAALVSIIQALQSSSPPSPAQVEQVVGGLVIHTGQQLATETQNRQALEQEFSDPFLQDIVGEWIATGTALSSCAVATAN